MLEFLRKKIKKQGGIWKYADFYAEKIEEKNRLMLRDGGTPLVEDADIDEVYGIDHLYFKREDENETGSLKGRSLCYQVSLNKQRGAGALTISTSGNAGIAAAAYARKAGLKLFVFISPDTEKGKVTEMQKYGPVIIRSKRAIRFANYAAAKYRLPNLRPSVDDDSIEGFKSIAFELGDEAGDVDAVFSFVTSGSSFVGMYRGFEAYKRSGKIGKIPEMYAVQSGEISSIAGEFKENGSSIAEEDRVREEGIRAGQLGVKNTKRKKEILEIIGRTCGKGIYVDGHEIGQAAEILRGKGLETSLEGCASFAAFIKVQRERKFKKAVCIFSGKLRGHEDEIDETKICGAESFEEVDGIITHNL